MADLTARQRQVLDRLARGRTHKEIARDLDISVNTVQDHVSGWPSIAVPRPVNLSGSKLEDFLCGEAVDLTTEPQIRRAA